MSTNPVNGNYYLSYEPVGQQTIKNVRNENVNNVLVISADAGDNNDWTTLKRNSGINDNQVTQAQQQVLDELNAEIKKLEAQYNGESKNRGFFGTIGDGISSLWGGGSTKLKNEIEEKKKLLAQAVNNPAQLGQAYKKITGKELTQEALNNAQAGKELSESLTGADKTLIANSLKEQAALLSSDLDKAYKDQGWLGKTISFCNNGLGFGTSEAKSKGKIEEYQKLVNSLDPNSENFAAQYKAITGEDLTLESLEGEKGLLNGYSKVADSFAAESVMDYEQTQATGKEIVCGVGTALVVVGAVALAIPSGGLSLGAVALGAGVGAATNVTLRSTDGLTSAQGYSWEQLGRDAASGAIQGALIPVSGGIAGATGKALGIETAKQVGKVTAKQVAINTVSGAAAGATYGGVYGGGNYIAQNAGKENFSFEELGKTTLTGVVAGAAGGAVGGATNSFVRPALTTTSGQSASLEIAGRLASGGITGLAAGSAGGFAAGSTSYLWDGLVDGKEMSFEGWLDASLSGAKTGAVVGTFVGVAFEAVNLAAGVQKPQGTAKTKTETLENGMEIKNHYDKNGDIIAQDFKANDMAKILGKDGIQNADRIIRVSGKITDSGQIVDSLKLNTSPSTGNAQNSTALSTETAGNVGAKTADSGQFIGQSRVDAYSWGGNQRILGVAEYTQKPEGTVTIETRTKNGAEVKYYLNKDGEPIAADIKAGDAQKFFGQKGTDRLALPGETSADYPDGVVRLTPNKTIMLSPEGQQIALEQQLKIEAYEWGSNQMRSASFSQTVNMPQSYTEGDAPIELNTTQALPAASPTSSNLMSINNGGLKTVDLTSINQSLNPFGFSISHTQASIITPAIIPAQSFITPVAGDNIGANLKPLTETNALNQSQAVPVVKDNLVVTTTNVEADMTKFRESISVLRNPTSSPQQIITALKTSSDILSVTKMASMQLETAATIEGRVANSAVLSQNPQLATEILNEITSYASPQSYGDVLSEISKNGALWRSETGVSLNSVSEYLNSKAGIKTTGNSKIILVDDAFIDRYSNHSDFSDEVNKLIKNDKNLIFYDAQGTNPFALDYIERAETLMPKVQQLMKNNPNLTISDAIYRAHKENLPDGRLKDIKLQKLPETSGSKNPTTEQIAQNVNKMYASGDDIMRKIQEQFFDPQDQARALEYLQHELSVDSIQTEMEALSRIKTQIDSLGIDITAKDTYFIVPREDAGLKAQIKSYDRIAYMFSQMYDIPSDRIIITDTKNKSLNLNIPKNANIICVDDLAGSGKSLIEDIPNALMGIKNLDCKSITIAPISVTIGSTFWKGGQLQIDDIVKNWTNATTQKEQDGLLSQLQAAEMYELLNIGLNENNNNATIARDIIEQKYKTPATENLFNGKLNGKFNYVSGGSISSINASEYYNSLNEKEQFLLKEVIGYPNGALLGYKNCGTAKIGTIMSTNTDTGLALRTADIYGSRPKYYKINPNDFIGVDRNLIDGFIQFSPRDNKKVTAFAIGSDLYDSVKKLPDDKSTPKGDIKFEAKSSSGETCYIYYNPGNGKTHIQGNNFNLISTQVSPSNPKLFILTK